jgi:uncharacterized protein YndB with AHSA1/START domain
MPANKDFKRLVRSRMEKTGEAYTAARAHLLTTKQQAPSPTRPSADYATLAGMSDTVIKEKTGCNWERWVKALDSAGAHTWPHRDIARHVREEFGIPGWWSQSVTVGYERIKGLRAIGQRRDGGFEVNKTKTFPVPLARLYRAWSDARTRKRWLPVELTVRKATANKGMRITWPDQSSVVLDFTSKGAGKSLVAVQHGKLADQAVATRMKAFWTERLSDLGVLLTPGG